MGNVDGGHLWHGPISRYFSTGRGFYTYIGGLLPVGGEKCADFPYIKNIHKKYQG